mmetsp:Transcript_9173/g.27540  ORF Transcript_9173/g.27540 Transcript_9173/m.27540 type:complete len:207 (+) Transcript_9173:766-1386(+)
MHLHCCIQDGQHYLGRQNLGSGDLAASLLRSHPIQRLCRCQYCPPGGVQVHPVEGELLHEGALLRHRLPEGHPGASPRRHELHRPLPQPNDAHAVVEATGPQSPLSNLETPPPPQQQVALRNLHIAEVDLCMAQGCIIKAEHVQRTHNLHARGIHGHQHHGLLAVGHSGGVGFAHEDGQPADGGAGPRGPPLLPVHPQLPCPGISD